MADMKLAAGDIAAIVVYFAAVLGVGLYSLCRPNRGTVSGYFLAGRYMIWLPVGASLFASNIGSEHFVGLAGSGAASGIAVGAFEFNACLLCQLLGWVFLPTYIASGVCTLPEYMKKRFGGGRIQIYLACLSLMLYIFTKISVNMFAGALFIQQALGWDIYFSILLLLAMTAICTVTGGLAAVIYTDTLQAFVMVIGASVLAIMSFIRVGGYQGLKEQYPNAIANSTQYSNSTCGYPNPKAFQMLRDPWDKDMPWPGFLLGQTPASIWYWCADQLMVQRALAAKSLSHAQGGTILTGFLKLLPLFVIVMPGMISRVLFPDEVGCTDPDECFRICQSRSGCSNIAYPKLVLGVMPIGLRGVMLAVMLAALMSDLTSIFNSASTLFTMDIYRKIRQKAKTKELMIVGRAFVVVMVIIGIVWIPVIQKFQGGQLFIYIQVLSAHWAPPIAAVYLVAILWKRGNEKGAFSGLMVGAITGLIRMILDFVYVDPECGMPDDRPSIIKNFHYMYFATFLFWLSGAVMVVVSYLTQPPTKEMLCRTTFWTRFEKTPEEEKETGDQEVKTICEDSDLMDPPKHDEENGGPRCDKNGRVKSDADLSASKDNKHESLELIVVKTPEKKLTVLRRAFNWFCGFDDTDEGQKRKMEQEAHLKGIQGLKQDKRAKCGLQLMLATIVTIAVFLYGFFSAPSMPASSYYTPPTNFDNASTYGR
ncbi:sodium/mannose cotransporter SLC5A10-like [Lineus longissimus]|uniref:sodium/mannose cotransporter SLC5A10-like n=1 Tax=Lineus longissimus TaxID=88925 RepID=UPI002B4F45E3